MATANQRAERDERYIEYDLTLAGHPTSIPWSTGPSMTGRCTPNSHLIRFHTIGLVYLRDPHLGTLETPVNRPNVQMTYKKSASHIHVITATEAARLYHAQCPYMACHQYEKKYLAWKPILGDCVQITKTTATEAQQSSRILRNKDKKNTLLKEGTRFDLVLMFHGTKDKTHRCQNHTHNANDLEEGEVKWLRAEHVKQLETMMEVLPALVHRGVDIRLSPRVRLEYQLNIDITPPLAREKFIAEIGKLASEPTSLFNRAIQVLHHSHHSEWEKLPTKLAAQVKEIIYQQQQAMCQIERCYEKHLDQTARQRRIDQERRDEVLDRLEISPNTRRMLEVLPEHRQRSIMAQAREDLNELIRVQEEAELLGLFSEATLAELPPEER